MAENIAHLGVYETATDGATYTEVDGLKSYGNDRMHDVLITTHFKDTSGHQLKVMGLRDGKLSLGGDITFRASTFILDAGIANIIQRARDGGALSVRAKVDGSGGTYLGAATLVSEFSLSANVSGFVEWSATLQFNGAGWA